MAPVEGTVFSGVTDNETEAALTLLEFSSPMKACMTPRDKGTMESPPGTIPFHWASPGAPAGLLHSTGSTHHSHAMGLASPGFEFNVAGTMDEKSLSPFFATVSPSRPGHYAVQGGMDALTNSGGAGGHEHKSSSKHLGRDGAKKTFCTKLNFPSEPAHKVWLALTKERATPPDGSSQQAKGDQESTSPDGMPALSTTQQEQSGHEDLLAAGGNGDSMWLADLDDEPKTLQEFDSFLPGGPHIASPRNYYFQCPEELDDNGEVYEPPSHVPYAPQSSHNPQQQQGAPTGGSSSSKKVPLTPSTSTAAPGGGQAGTAANQIQFRLKKSTSSSSSSKAALLHCPPHMMDMADDGFKQEVEEEEVLGPQDPHTVASGREAFPDGGASDPSRLYGNSHSRQQPGAPPSSASSTSSSSSSSRFLLSFSTGTGQIPHRSQLFSPTQSEASSSATPRQYTSTTRKQAETATTGGNKAPRSGGNSRRTCNGACNCKKSRCLKMYCECFRARRHCGESCKCKDCANNPANEAVRQEAIARTTDRKSGAVMTSTRRTRALPKEQPSGEELYHHQQPRSLQASTTGCSCKASGCSSGHCPCYQASRGCGSACKCGQCYNPGGVHQPVSEWHAASSQQETQSPFAAPPAQQQQQLMLGVASPSLSGTPGADGNGRAKRIRFCLSPMAGSNAPPALTRTRFQQQQHHPAAVQPTFPRVDSPVRKVGTTKRPPRGPEEFLLPVFGPRSAVNKKGSLQVFSFLDEEDMAMVSLVSRQWNRLSMETEQAQHIFG